MVLPDGIQIVDLTFLDKGLKSVDGFNSRPIGGQYQVPTKTNLAFGAITLQAAYSRLACSHNLPYF